MIGWLRSRDPDTGLWLADRPFPAFWLAGESRPAEEGTQSQPRYTADGEGGPEVDVSLSCEYVIVKQTWR